MALLMARYKRILSIDTIAATHKKVLRNILLAEELARVQRSRGLPVTGALAAAEGRKTLLALNRGLEDVARRTAVDANKAINKWITKTKSGRPSTGNKPNLRSSIRSRPLHRHGPIATGEVGIADLDVLDDLVNPRYPQYGPYWRAQEQGTQGQKGRVVYGGFYGKGMSGGPFRPDPSQSRAHPIFVSTAVAGAAYASLGFRGGPGPRGGKGGGKMTIGTEIKPRRFIERGAEEAAVLWAGRVRSVEAQAMRSAARIGAAAIASGRRPPRRR